jgi:hypothetical protein
VFKFKRYCINSITEIFSKQLIQQSATLCNKSCKIIIANNTIASKIILVMTKRITNVAQLEFFIVNYKIYILYFENKYVRFNNGSATVNINENK